MEDHQKFFLSLEDLEKTSLQKTFWKSSVYRRPSEPLRSTEDIQEVFGIQKSFRRSCVYKNVQEVLSLQKIFRKSSVYKKPTGGLLSKETHPKVFCLQEKTNKRSSVFRRQTGEDKNEVLDHQNTFKRSSVYNSLLGSLLYKKDLQEVFCLKKVLQVAFCLQKTIKRYTAYRKPSGKDIQEVFDQ